jgi:hypothetical protein
MSTRCFLLVVLVCSVSGCVCRYEGIETQRVAMQTVSDQALAAFVRAQPSEAVEHVEMHTFKRKIVSYTVTFRRLDGTTHQVMFARDGTVIPPRADAQEKLR